MFQKVIDKITIYLTPDMNSLMIRALESFKTSDLTKGYIAKNDPMCKTNPKEEMEFYGLNRQEDIELINKYISLEVQKLRVEDLVVNEDQHPIYF